MIGHTLAKFYMLLLEKNISLWSKIHGKRAKGKSRFRRHKLIVDHLVTPGIVVEECCNNKIDLFYCFVDFRKAFDTIPREKLLKMLK